MIGLSSPGLIASNVPSPHVCTVPDLKALVAGFASPHEFVRETLQYNHDLRARTLADVVVWVAGISGNGPPGDQCACLKAWATCARFADGADTTKPDIRICRRVECAIGCPVSPAKALALLERAAPEAGVSLRAADTTIWERAARAATGGAGSQAGRKPARIRRHR